jgi:glycosyltransferase involved in cell wall biosynthesis
MRIGIDATALPPQPVGAGYYIINLIRALSLLKTEHQIVVFAQKARRGLFELSEESTLEWVSVSDKNPAIRLIWEQAAFPGLVRRHKVDLLHSLHYTRPLKLPCKSVVTFHDMTFLLFPQFHTRAKRLFFPLAIRYSAASADAIIADSENTRQDAIRLLGISPQKIFGVPLGVDERFRPFTDPFILSQVKEKYTLPDHFILYVGLVEPRKNLSLLVESYKNLISEGIPHPLVIVGRLGWMYQSVLKEIERLGLKDRVHFTGYIPFQDLPMVYNLADIFVYPTVYEGFGLPPLEAMACGTPVITTAVSSIPEHVGDAGILVPPNDARAITRAMAAVLSDAALKEKLIERGPKQASYFTWERTARKTLQVYQKLI